MSKLWSGFARLIPDRRGVAAVEFALVAPLLLSMYFVTMEVGLGIEASRKVSRAGSMVADLIAQQSEITPDQLEAIMKIGESIMQPYNRSSPTITVTAINIKATSEVEVAWSGKLEDGDYEVVTGSPATVPPDLNLPGTFLVRVDSLLIYKPLITWSDNAKQTLGLMAALDDIEMKATYYLRPRMSSTIECEDC